MKKLSKYIIFFLITFLLQAGARQQIDPVANAVMHNDKGIKFMQEGFYYPAINEFRIAIALNHNSAASAAFYNNIGLAYIKIHKYDWAINTFDKAIKLNPIFLEYYKNLAKAYKYKKALPKQVNKYVSIIKKDQENSRAWLMLGLMYVEMKYNYEAKYCFRKFKELEPENILIPSLDQISEGL